MKRVTIVMKNPMFLDR